MLRTDENSLYRALLQRDRAYEGFAYVGVITTGIFCRLSCSARKPKRENVRFFDTVDAAVAAGFRACHRCRPANRGPSSDAAMTQLRQQAIDTHGSGCTTRDLVRMGFDPSTVRRAFKRQYGITFGQFARAQRLGRAVANLRAGGRAIDAQLEAGYESSSGFRQAMTRALQLSPQRLAGTPTLAATWIDTPLGVMLAVAGDRGLCLLEFADRRALPTEMRRLRRHYGPIALGAHPLFDSLRRELAGYFAGESAKFSVALDRKGTPFEERAWLELQRVAPGATRSYADIARAMRQPRAVRAVARANGKNQLAIIIPCHRVIGSDGALTGYGGKLWRKRWLLEHEARHWGRAARVS